MKKTDNNYYNSFWKVRQCLLCITEHTSHSLNEEGAEKTKGSLSTWTQQKTDLPKNQESWPVDKEYAKQRSKLAEGYLSILSIRSITDWQSRIFGHALNNIIHHTSARGSHVQAIYHHHITRLSTRRGDRWLLTSREVGFIAGAPQNASWLCPKQNVPCFTSV